MKAMKNRLEKILNFFDKAITPLKGAEKKTALFFKDNYRAGILTAVFVLGGLNEKVEASRIRILNRAPSVNSGFVHVNHIVGGGEDYHYLPPYGDATYLESPNYNQLLIYSVNDNCYPNKLLTDTRDPNSTTSFSLELASNGFDSGPYSNSLRFMVQDDNDLDWKNIFLGGSNNSETLVADIKNKVYINGQIISGYPTGDFQLGVLDGSNTGVYDRRKVKFFNHADLDRNGKVNFEDYAIFAQNWGRTGIVKGSDPNALGDYADMADVYDETGKLISYGNGSVGIEDLAAFCIEWLWDANDPNTWNRNREN